MASFAMGGQGLPPQQQSAYPPQQNRGYPAPQGQFQGHSPPQGFIATSRPGSVHPAPTQAASPQQYAVVQNPTFAHVNPQRMRQHHQQQQQGNNAVVNMGQPRIPVAHNGGKSPKQNNETAKPSKPGCVKRLSHKSQVFQRSDMGTCIMSLIRIALAATSIAGVASAFAGEWRTPRHCTCVAPLHAHFHSPER